MVAGIISYWLFSILIVTILRHGLGDSFYEGTNQSVREHNLRLLEEYKNKKISALQYRNGLQTIDKERRLKVQAYYLLAPIVCPRILFWFIRDMVTYIIVIIRFWMM